MYETSTSATTHTIAVVSHILHKYASSPSMLSLPTEERDKHFSFAQAEYTGTGGVICLCRGGEVVFAVWYLKSQQM